VGDGTLKSLNFSAWNFYIKNYNKRQ